MSLLFQGTQFSLKLIIFAAGEGETKERLADVFHSPFPPPHPTHFIVTHIREGGLLFGMLTFAKSLNLNYFLVGKKNPILSSKDSKTSQHKNAPKVFQESLFTNNSMYAVLCGSSKHSD